jgi:hypothetical protein
MEHVVRYLLAVRRAALPVAVVVGTMAGMVMVARAQSAFVYVEPECRIYFSFAAVGTSAVFDNRTKGCDYWAVSYSSFIFAGPLSMALQSAPNAAGSVPGAWVNFAGAVVTGINPNTSLVGAETTLSGYYPWLRVNLTATGAGAGLVVGTAYGWRMGAPTSVSGTVTANQGTPNAGGVNAWPVQGGSAAGAALVGNPVPVSGTDAAGVKRSLRTQGDGALALTGGVTPNDGTSGAFGGGLFRADTGAISFPVIYPLVYNGTNWDRQRGSTAGTLGAGLGSGATGGVIGAKTVCDSQAVVTLAAAGNTEIVALTAARQIRVCHFSASFQSPVDVQFTQGTGANCAVGTANVSGVYQDVLAAALDFADGSMRTAAGNALCVSLGAAVTGGGIVTYAVY